MAHTFTCLTTHIVFSTKERCRLIDDELSSRLIPYLGGTIRSLGGRMLRANAVEDHVHLLARLPAKLSIAVAVRKIKGGSSKWIHEEWDDRSSFAWQRGYGAFGVSQSHVESVGRYIDSQQEHHRRFDFETEFLALLQKHGIDFDPAYLWK